MCFSGAQLKFRLSEPFQTMASCRQADHHKGYTTYTLVYTGQMQYTIASVKVFVPDLIPTAPNCFCNYIDLSQHATVDK